MPKRLPNDKSLWEVVTTWHYEGRERRNHPVPEMDEAIKSDAWVKMTIDETRFHDDDRGKPEMKFITRDGREVVYDGNTGEIVTEPELAGTYNYIAPHSRTQIEGPVDALKYAVAGIGHWIVDVLPFKLLGSARPRSNVGTSQQH